MQISPAFSLFDQLPIGAYRSTPDGRPLRANAALVRLNACASEAELLALSEDIARPWYVDPQRRDAFITFMQTQGQVLNFESEVRRIGTGERTWVRENACAVRDADGRLLHFEGTVEDITEMRQAQQALALSERRLQALRRRLEVDPVAGLPGGPGRARPAAAQAGHPHRPDPAQAGRAGPRSPAGAAGACRGDRQHGQLGA